MHPPFQGSKVPGGPNVIDVYRNLDFDGIGGNVEIPS